jgi:hypothetical protein
MSSKPEPKRIKGTLKLNIGGKQAPQPTKEK